MKISPKKKTKTKKYPTFRDYKRKFMLTTFTIGFTLTPAMLTSCMGAQKPPAIEKNKTESKTTNKKENIDNKENIAPKNNDINKPVNLGGVPKRIQDDENLIPCDTSTPETNKKDKKDSQKKDTKTDKDKVNIPVKPTKLRGKIKVIPDNK
jgi:hypothetical protein